MDFYHCLFCKNFFVCVCEAFFSEYVILCSLEFYKHFYYGFYV